MSFLTPFPLMLAALAAAIVVALHLLTTRRPPPLMLPTARFVPVAEARAVARASKPTDLVLLALRALALLLVGAAFARPVMDAAGPSVRAVVLLERSRAVADPAQALERARAEAGEGGAVVVFGAEAREASGDSLAALAAAAASGDASVHAFGDVTSGSLSAAFIAARAAAARIAPGADSVRLVVVSPLVAGSVDAATRSLRESWPGRVELVRVAARVDTARGAAAELLTPLADDPLAPAIARLGGISGGDGVRIQRGPSTSADSAWVRGGDRVLLVWPARFEAPVRAMAVTALSDRDSSVTVVAPFARLPLAGDTTRVIARWNDGAPAVTQRALGAGCVRDVGVGVPLAGDITLRPPFARLLDALAVPCIGRTRAPLADSLVSWLGPTATDDVAATPTPTPTPLALARLVAAEDSTRSSRLPAILLAIALAALAAEQVLRRRSVA